MKTLQEYKDEVSFEMFSVPYDNLLVESCQLNVLEEAAKRFAREACKEIADKAWEAGCEREYQVIHGVGA